MQGGEVIQNTYDFFASQEGSHMFETVRCGMKVLARHLANSAKSAYQAMGSAIDEAGYQLRGIAMEASRQPKRFATNIGLSLIIGLSVASCTKQGSETQVVAPITEEMPPIQEGGDAQEITTTLTITNEQALVDVAQVGPKGIYTQTVPEQQATEIAGEFGTGGPITTTAEITDTVALSETMPLVVEAREVEPVDIEKIWSAIRDALWKIGLEPVVAVANSYEGIRVPVENEEGRMVLREVSPISIQIEVRPADGTPDTRTFAEALTEASTPLSDKERQDMVYFLNRGLLKVLDAGKNADVRIAGRVKLSDLQYYISIYLGSLDNVLEFIDALNGEKKLPRMSPFTNINGGIASNATYLVSVSEVANQEAVGSISEEAIFEYVEIGISEELKRLPQKEILEIWLDFLAAQYNAKLMQDIVKNMNQKFFDGEEHFRIEQFQVP
ncbi:hypothetical protein IPJ91_00555 [bacterium]|nr:MAG: hypothetical protein IPJ91_00555 [bacterium]